MDIKDDMLRGLDEIAEFLNLRRHTVHRMLINKHEPIPAGRMGNSWIASRRKLTEHFAKRMQADPKLYD